MAARVLARVFVAVLWIALVDGSSAAAPPPPPVNFTVGGMAVSLTQDQTVASLRTLKEPFDFAPPPTRVSQRLGDVTLRVRPAGALPDTPYTTATTARSRNHVEPIQPKPKGDFAAATLELEGLPNLTLTRHWSASPDGIGLHMRFELTNNGSAVEIGAFGASMIFMTKSVGGGKSLDEMADTCAMVDPAIAGEVNDFFYYSYYF